MTWIKICGITNVEDAQTAVDAGVDALGFVFYEKSPRHVTLEKVREITARLPTEIEKVGVFVDEGDLWENIEALIKHAGLTSMQLQAGQANVTGCCLVAPAQTRMYLGIPVEAIGQYPEWIPAIERMLRDRPGSAALLDSGTSQQPGGTGTPFDWRKNAPSIRVISASVPVIVAGGLTAENVKDAMATLRPWGVDVSSGVEARPGKKDPEKIRAFVAAVREAEASY
jgi:phosphoribosylanthranilate isomerase